MSAFKKILLLCLLITSVHLHAIKFNIIGKNEKEVTLRLLFETGFSAEAISDGIGVVDYETVFFRPSFFIGDFGFGLDFDFRFRLFIGEFDFREEDWYVEGDALQTAFSYIDKIDFIQFGDFESPFYVHTGKNPTVTLGTGFLVHNFHNHSFLPTSREQGLYFHFNGEYLDKYELKKVPIDASFLMNDLLDPDIFAADFGINIFQLTKLKDKFDLRIGAAVITDINTLETNRLSSQDAADITSHRNLSESNSNFTSFPLFFSVNEKFLWANKYVQLNIYEDNVFLLDFLNPADNTFHFGFGIMAGTEIKVINLKKSGYLLGITTDFIMESSYFFLNYFSSNYEVLRNKQYHLLQSNNDYTFYVKPGISLYGFDEKFSFKMHFTIPLIMTFAARISSEFVLKDTLIKGLYMRVFYETGMNVFYLGGNRAQGFIDTLTRDFRFSFEAGYQFYGAKLSIVLGIQRPGWVVPEVVYDSKIYTRKQFPRNPYEQLAQGYYIPNQFTDPDYYKTYNPNMNLTQYAADLEKFVSLEISFVF